MQNVYVYVYYIGIKYTLVMAACVQKGPFVVENNMCTGNVWLVDYTCVGSNIGS